MPRALKSAIVRLPAPTYHLGLTTQDPGRGNYDRFLQQHHDYVATLETAGLTVETLPALDRFPDAHFVEDVAIVTPEATVLTRPGAAARRGEELAMLPVLEVLGPLARIVAPGTLDGGDILFVGRHCLIGQSERTNRAGMEQLAAILEPHGYACRAIDVDTGLHLKSSINEVGDDAVIVTPALARQPALATFRRIETAPGEDDAANALLVNDYLLVPSGYPATTERLAALGHEIVELEVSQASRMDGGLTCLSLRF